MHEERVKLTFSTPPSIIFNEKFIILNTKFIIFNEKFIILNTKFLILNETVHHCEYHGEHEALGSQAANHCRLSRLTSIAVCLRVRVDRVGVVVVHMRQHTLSALRNVSL